MDKNKELFNVLYADNIPSTAYNLFIERVVDKKINIIQHNDRDSKIDLIIFTGGEDVSPEYYSERKGKYTSCNSTRDSIEKNIFDNKSYRTPKLGICRGAQFLTVMNGGTLIQHVENHGNCTHPITILDSLQDKIIVEIPSDHHQMMNPYYLPDSYYEIIGYSTFFRSGVYLNGDDINHKLKPTFLEPEIVYYPRTSSLAIQPHPEWMDYESKDFKIIKNLIIKKLLNNTK